MIGVVVVVECDMAMFQSYDFESLYFLKGVLTCIDSEQRNYLTATL